MFYDLKKFPFLEKILENVDALSAEFESQRHAAFMSDFLTAPLPGLASHTEHWIRENGLESTQTGYDVRNGSWAAFPLYKKGFPIKWYDVESTFPKTLANILSVPEVNFSSFFKIAPNSGTEEHSHAISNFIFHLCLFDVEGSSVIRCNGEEKEFSKKGDWCLFDYSQTHSSFNYGKKDRINLVIDFSSSSK